MITTPDHENQNRAYFLSSIVFILSLVIYASLSQDGLFKNCDSTWHLAAGDFIRNHGQIPRTDPWSVTAGDSNWFNLSWFYDVAISWIDDILGLRGLVAFNLIAAALLPAFLTRVCIDRGASILASLIAGFLAMLLFMTSLSLRPQQITLLFAITALWICIRNRQHETKWVWFLPILTVLWVNMHGSYLILYSIVGSFFLEALFGRDLRRAKTLFLVGIACVIATMINPYGYQIFYASWLSLGSEMGQKYILEWQAPTFATRPHTFILLALLLLYQFRSRISLPLAEVILIIFWMVMAFTAVRHSAIIGIFVIPVLAVMWTSLIEQKNGRMKRAEQTFHKDFGQRQMATGAVIAAAILALAFIVPFTRNMIVEEQLYDSAVYPVDEINYLKNNFARNQVFNDYCYGGNIIYQAGGLVNPVLDSRIDTVYPQGVIHDYFKMLYFKPGWQELARKYDLSLAIFPNENLQSVKAFQDAGWDAIYAGKVATIYQRKEVTSGPAQHDSKNEQTNEE